MALTVDTTMNDERLAPEPEEAAPGHAPRKPLLPESEELFRGIYTRAGLTAPGIVAITSAISGEGKTTIALGLAVMVAQDFPERRVLLVETDLARPVLASDFAVEPSPGLAEALDGVYPVAMGYRETFLPNLRLLPAGELHPNPSRLLRSARLGAVLASARRNHDLVIVDALALLVNSDAALVCDQADGTLIVVRAGMTPVPVVNRAMELVDPERVRGVVLNGSQSAVPGWLRRIFGI
ncbi:MAG: CpsD/CapB family tyrosine-protein kinase [Chloroflexi bacterium]|nr:CpsD/CapB family tyrosine-protein kinase [Chloroflexota bacterium]